MRQTGTPTKYPGVYKLENRKFRVRGKVTDPRNGKKREIDRILTGLGAQAAARMRAEMLDQLRAGANWASGRVRIGEYAQSWMRSKALKLDDTTADRYADALELHILPAFGDLYYEALTSRDIQSWVDDALYSKRQRGRRKGRPYAWRTVHSWFRVLRTMTRDAMAELDLDRDPTLRVSFPEESDTKEPNTLSSAELARFLRGHARALPDTTSP